MRNLESGYTVFDVATEVSKIVTCTGYIVPPKYSTKVEVVGIWKVDHKYGNQLTNCVIRDIILDDADVMEYLLAIDGVGEATATAVKDGVGTDILNIAQQADPVHYLIQKTGIPINKAEDIVQYVQSNVVRSNLFVTISMLNALH